MIVTYLRLFRIHTAALTWAAAILGYAVAGGSVFSFEALLFAVFGVIFHGIGFLDNNVMDYEYDRNDSNKRHFPLVTGEVSFYTADLIVKIGLVIGFLYGMWLAQSNTVALTALAVGIISGLIYNRYNKRHYWKGVPISLCFAMIPLFSYLAVGSNPTSVIGWVGVYVFLQVYFQITVSGELKEIEAASEKSILRSLGAKVGPSDVPGVQWFDAEGSFYLYSYTVKILNILAGLVIVFLSSSYYQFIAFGVMSIWIIIGPTRSLLRSGRWDRKARLRDMSLVEMLSYYLLVIILSPILGVYETIFMIAAPTAWFLGFNRLIWGRTYLAPKV